MIIPQSVYHNLFAEKNDVETHLKFPVQIRPWLSNHECVSSLNKQCMMDYFNLHEIKNE